MEYTKRVDRSKEIAFEDETERAVPGESEKDTMETLELEITEFLGEAKHKLRKSKGPNLFLTHTFEVERAVRIFSSKGKMGLFLLQNL